MKRKKFGSMLFNAANCLFLSAVAFTCLLPMINQLAISFSSSGAVAMGAVGFWPVDFTLSSYQFMARKPEFFTSLGVSLERLALGVPVNMLVTVLAAYPLSKENKAFGGRKFYVWYIIVTMLFSGGLVPWYMTVKYTGLIDKIWALVLPGAVPVFNIVLLMNFFRTIPREIEEAAIIDGASHARILAAIYLPVSAPAIATLTLFCIVNHWNSWFDGLIFMNTPEKYPLQTYLQTIVVSRDLSFLKNVKDLKILEEVSDRTGKAAQIFIAALPVLAVYPFLQKYFTKGIVLGSVKG
jgi:putative aldouronate transport system permease protein